MQSSEQSNEEGRTHDRVHEVNRIVPLFRTNRFDPNERGLVGSRASSSSSATLVIIVTFLRRADELNRVSVNLLRSDRPDLVNQVLNLGSGQFPDVRATVLDWRSESDEGTPERRVERCERRRWRRRRKVASAERSTGRSEREMVAQGERIARENEIETSTSDERSQALSLHVDARARGSHGRRQAEEFGFDRKVVRVGDIFPSRFVLFGKTLFSSQELNRASSFRLRFGLRQTTGGRSVELIEALPETRELCEGARRFWFRRIEARSLCGCCEVLDVFDRGGASGREFVVELHRVVSGEIRERDRFRRRIHLGCGSEKLSGSRHGGDLKWRGLSAEMRVAVRARK